MAATLLVSRTDMNHSAEIYAVNDITNGNMRQVTHENDDVPIAI